jgi:hypothetical protein
LNLADIDGMLLSTGLRMIIMRVEFNTSRTLRCWSAASERSAPAPGPANKPANTCHKNQRETAWKTGHLDDASD